MDDKLYWINQLDRIYAENIENAEIATLELRNRSFPWDFIELSILGFVIECKQEARHTRKLLLGFLEDNGGTESDIALNALAGNLILN